MSEEIGTVISTTEGPSPSQLSFVVNKGIIHRGQFVEIGYSEGKMIALVTDLVKSNRYFERSESVKEFEAQGKKLFESFPTSEWEYLEAKCRPLGVYQKGMLSRTTHPPSPGDKVSIANASDLEKFLGFDKEKGLLLGEVPYHGVPVKLNLTKLFQKHLAILSLSGGGKSYSTSVLFEELLDRKKEFGRIAVIVLDVHGEYSSFAQKPTKGEKDYSTQTRIIHARDFKIGVSKLSAGMISSFIPKTTSQQTRELNKVIMKLRKEMREGLGPYDFHSIKGELLKDEEINEKTKAALISWIDSLQAKGMFSKTDSVSLDSLIQPGKLLVVDLSDVIEMQKKQILVTYFASRLFNERRAKKIPPYLLVLEESHQFVPEGASRENAICRPIIETIAREGRKFGASLCLISQRPIQLSTTALSQCNTKLILRITNPYDLDHIGKSAESLDKGSLDMITSLRVGEALLVGEAVNYPLFFKVRKRNSMESIHGQSLEDVAKSFEENKEEQTNEAEEYL
ncbi:MAG: ATP-binding protein [Candidatus Diapherotrites archaeon]